MIDRRSVLRDAVGGFAGLAFAPFAQTAFAADVPTVTPIDERFYLLSGIGGNILVRATEAAQVLVDSGIADATDGLLAALVDLPGSGRTDTLFNTHWHLEQVGGNEAFGRMGARIVAHEKTRIHLATDYYLPAEDRYEKAVPADAHPTDTFYTSGSLELEDETIEYGYLLEAHTDGDIFIYFRNANLLAVGDALSPVRDPVLDWFGGGWLGGRVDSLDLLLSLSNSDTRIVPSYGPVVGRTELQAEHDLMLAVFEIMRELVRKGEGAEDIVAGGALDDLPRTFDDPLKFVYDAHKSMWAHYNTLSPDIV
jgi:cyclase